MPLAHVCKTTLVFYLKSSVSFTNKKKTELLFVLWKKKKSSLRLLEHFEPEESAVIANYCCMLAVLINMFLKLITATQQSSRPVIIYLRI